MPLDKMVSVAALQLQNQTDIFALFPLHPTLAGHSAKTSAPLKCSRLSADFVDAMIAEFGSFFEWVELWNRSIA